MTQMIAIFDLGRTHKKFLLFDKDYKIIDETAAVIPDVKDEDGEACENIEAISTWIKSQLNAALQNKNYDIKAINFSAHGASFVHIDDTGKPVSPLYDYMKPINAEITEAFYGLFGGKDGFSIATGSPALGLLNSGMQLYWLKKTKPDNFSKIKTSLHLPQYGNYIFSHKKHADITSIGCHTGLWNFKNQAYHQWLTDENIISLLPPTNAIDETDLVQFGDQTIPVGIGIHDSSAALLPFVKTTQKPFVLLSSGTWNITLNPFFKSVLTKKKYLQDCLYYLLDVNQKVAASRLFLGSELEHQVKKLEAYFNKSKGYYQQVRTKKEFFDEAIENRSEDAVFFPETMKGNGPFPDLPTTQTDLSKFSSFEAAYYKMMLDFSYLQKLSIELVSEDIKRLYISGGFLKNDIFKELLQGFLPEWQLFSAENKRASSLGAALAIHGAWQREPLSNSISPITPLERQYDLDLNRYRPPKYKTI